MSSSTWVEREIPASVRGMQTLDRTAFRAEFSVPCVSVPSTSLPRVLYNSIVKPSILPSIKGVRHVVSDETNRDRKVVLLAKDALDDDKRRATLSDALENATSEPPVFSKHDVRLDFENFEWNQLVRAVLPEGVEFSGFTQTGHIIHCNFHDELRPYRHLIAEILLAKVKNVRTVLTKEGMIENEFRNFAIELLAGEENYETEVVEHGIRYKMDFSKVFWNSRLQHEHDRVVTSLDENAIIFDACAGIGPFVLPAVRRRKCRRAFANDLNPESARWLKENAAINKMPADKISVHNLDAVEFLRNVAVPEIKKITPDNRPSGVHVIMNLPAFAVNFLPAFRGLLGAKTADDQTRDVGFPFVVYCYLFAKAHEDVPDSFYTDLARKMVAEKLGVEKLDENEDSSVRLRRLHHVRTVSNRKEMFCAEIELGAAFLFGADESEDDSLEVAKKKRRTDDDDE